MMKLITLSCFVSFTFAFNNGIGLDDLWTNNGIEYDNIPPIIPSIPYPYQNDLVRFEPQQPVAFFPAVPEKVVTPKEVVLAAAETKVGLISKGFSFVFSLLSSGVHFLIRNGVALAVGILSSLGICKLTPICSKISAVNSLGDFRRELGYFANSDRVTRAVEYVGKAIKKYAEMQK